MTATPATILSELIAGLPPDERAAVVEYLASCSTVAPRRQMRLTERDATIRATLSDYQNLSPSAAAKALAGDLGRYLANGWPREAHLTELPETASRLRRQLHKIAQLNEGRALAWRQILNIFDGLRTP